MDKKLFERLAQLSSERIEKQDEILTSVAKMHGGHAAACISTIQDVYESHFKLLQMLTVIGLPKPVMKLLSDQCSEVYTDVMNMGITAALHKNDEKERPKADEFIKFIDALRETYNVDQLRLIDEVGK